MTNSERIFNWLLGASVLSWAVLATYDYVWVAETSPRFPVAVLLITVMLHLCVGSLVLTRSPAVEQGNWFLCGVAIPAALIGAWLFPNSDDGWDTISQILFVGGGLLAITSFLFLGKCFAILPAVRGTVTRGPFSMIRHPAYLGEFIMLVACARASAFSLAWQTGLLMLAMLLLTARILAEEKLLLTHRSYRDYADRVRWRFIPLVW